MDNDPFRARNEVALMDRIGPYVMTIIPGLIGIATATNADVIQLLTKLYPVLGNLVVAGGIGALVGGGIGYMAWRALQRIGHNI